MIAAEKDYWRRFAGEALHLGSPLYQQLALAVDDDSTLKALAARARRSFSRLPGFCHCA
jgi:hypothetical protein